MLTTLITVATVLVLSVVLPLLSFRRASATRDNMARLERRLAALEDLVRSGRSTQPPVQTTPIAETVEAIEAPAPAPRTTLLPGDAAAFGDRHPEGASTAPSRLEARIGTRWMLYVGVAALVIGVGLFIRYAFVNQWITESARVGTGALTGALLVMFGRRFAKTDHRTFGHALVGGGISTWYLAVYAALNLYGLVNTTTGFLLLATVTMMATVQADRLRSQSLALLAVVGGFWTLVLVNGEANAQIALFRYTVMLIAATAYLSYRRDWPALHLASFLTGMTVLLWSVKLYRPGAFLATEFFFTLYGGLFLWILYRLRRSTHPTSPWIRLAFWITPVWYHAASLSILSDHWLALLVYLIAVTGVGVTLSVRWEAMWPRVALWVAVALPLLDWTDGQLDGSWLAPAVATWIAVTSIHAIAQIELLRRVRARLHAADVLLVPTNGLGLYFGLQAVFAPRNYAFNGLVAALIAIAHLGMVAAIRRNNPHAATHVRVVAIALAVVATAVQLDGAWVTMLWATEAGGLVWIGLKERRHWIRVAGVLLLAFSVVRLLEIQFAPVPSVYAVFLNERAALGLFLVGILCGIAWLHARIDSNTDNLRKLIMSTSIVGANVLMLVTLSTEIHGFWELRAATMRFESAELARQMMLSTTWVVYAAGLTAVGIKRHYPPIRYLAIFVLGATVLKVFTVDFSQLNSVYRILSSIALGILLVGASYLYQRNSGLKDAAEAASPS